MIEPVKRELEPVIYNEYIRAKEIHGDEYHSPHEAYAVLLEEFDEVQDAVGILQDHIATIKKIVFGYNKPNTDLHASLERNLRHTKGISRHVAAEAVQVAAVCQKAIESMDAWKKA